MVLHLKHVIAATKGKNREGREVHHSVGGTRPDGSTDRNLQILVLACLRQDRNALLDWEA